MLALASVASGPLFSLQLEVCPRSDQRLISIVNPVIAFMLGEVTFAFTTRMKSVPLGNRSITSVVDPAGMTRQPGTAFMASMSRWMPAMISATKSSWSLQSGCPVFYIFSSHFLIAVEAYTIRSKSDLIAPHGSFMLIACLRG